MADIYIIASEKNRSQVVKLSNFLQSKGFNTFWDDSLGHLWWWDKYISFSLTYKKFKQKQLDDSDFAVVIWSEDSVNQDAVRSQALQGLLEKKLIITRTNDMRLSDIPKPFSGFEIVSIEDGEAVFSALRKLVRPPFWKTLSHNMLLVLGVALTSLLVVASLSSLYNYPFSLFDLAALLPSDLANFYFIQIFEVLVAYICLLFALGGSRLVQANYLFHDIISFPKMTHFSVLFLFPVLSLALAYYLMSGENIRLAYLIVGGVIWCLFFVICIELIVSCNRLISESRLGFGYDIAVFLCVSAIYMTIVFANEVEYGVFYDFLFSDASAHKSDLDKTSVLLIVVLLLSSLLLATYFLLTQISPRKIFSRIICIFATSTIFFMMVRISNL